MSFTGSAKQLDQQLDKVFKQLGGKQVRHAHAKALTKTAREVKPVALRKSAAKLSISQKHLRPRIKVRGAKVKNLTARIWGGLAPVPLIKLKAKEVDGGVVAGKYLLPDAFIATATNSPKQKRKGRKAPSKHLVGKAQVFMREGREAYPLKAQGVNVGRVLRPQTKLATDRAMHHNMRINLLREYKKKVLKSLNVK